jgi:nicotinate-nucleotide adenylyltransferase
VSGHTAGILGGTFNPPHLGHLALADHALRQLDLARVVLIPSATAPHKPAAQDPGPEHRLAMCRLAIGQTPGLSVCEIELERGGPSYTVDTLTAIHARHPDAPLTFILGADIARTLPTWREPREILKLAELAIAERDGNDQGRLRAILDQVHPDARIRFLDMTAIEISSSAVRERISGGEPVESLVGPAVGAYIAQHGLYRDTAGVPG